MKAYTKSELEEAKSALTSTIQKCENINMVNLGKSQQTLLTRRIKALKLAIELIEREIRVNAGDAQ